MNEHPTAEKVSSITGRVGGAIRTAYDEGFDTGQMAVLVSLESHILAGGDPVRFVARELARGDGS